MPNEPQTHEIEIGVDDDLRVTVVDEEPEEIMDRALFKMLESHNQRLSIHQKLLIGEDVNMARKEFTIKKDMLDDDLWDRISNGHSVVQCMLLQLLRNTAILRDASTAPVVPNDPNTIRTEEGTIVKEE